MAERFYKRREVRERLGVSKYVYQQLIETGVLESPIRLTKNGHPVHTESQLQNAERRINRKTISKPSRSGGVISSKLFNEIAEAYGN